MGVFTTEIASDRILSDNPIHQRLLKAYYVAKDLVKGNLLEIGCGEGRGIEVLSDLCDSYTGLDKIEEVIEALTGQFPDHTFIQANIPPIADLPDNAFDTIVAFQVIEHIRNDRLFLEEIHRLLKPGGVALLSTPNIRKTLTRNPWHMREYTGAQLAELAGQVFSDVTVKGIAGNEKVMEYYTMNKRSVQKITRFDIFNLQYRLPASILRVPYDIMNRLNRNSLKKDDNSLVAGITQEDYLLTDDAFNALDLFCILRK